MASKATKVIAIILGGLIVTAGLSTNSLVANAAKDNTPKTYEAMLSLELKPSITTKEIASAIKKDLGNLNNIDILTIGSKLDFEGKTQTFTKSNEEQVPTQKILDSYSKSQNAFLNTIVNMKEQTDSGQSIENQDIIKPLLNKYSKKSLKNTQNKYKSKTPIISNIMLAGSLANIKKLNIGSLYSLASKAELIDLVEMQKQSDLLNAKIDKAKTQEEKDKILKDETTKLSPQGSGPISNLNLDQAKIQEIDKLTRKDLNGDIFIVKDEIKSKTGLTDSQIQEVSKAMKDFNKLPLEIKDNTTSSIQALVQTTQLKTEEDGLKDLGEKVGQFIFSKVKASAAGCGRYAKANFYWWGTQVYLNHCTINDIKFGLIGAAAILQLLAMYSPFTVYCQGAVIIIGLYAGWLDWSSNYCNSRGAYFNSTWINPYTLNAPWVQNIC